MSTTLATLKIVAFEMKESNQQVFSELSDADLESLYQTISKSDLKIDIIESLGFDVSDGDCDTNIDSLIDKYVKRFEKALMYKQCFYYYMNNNTGVDTYNYNRMMYYDNSYKAMKQKFNQMVLDNVDVGCFIPTGRM